MNISIDKIREIFGNMIVENLVLYSKIEALEKENEQLKQTIAALMKENEAVEDQSSNPNSNSILP